MGSICSIESLHVEERGQIQFKERGVSLWSLFSCLWLHCSFNMSLYEQFTAFEYASMCI